MKRRDFIALVGGGIAWPVVAGAQQPKVARIGASGEQPLLVGRT